MKTNIDVRISSTIAVILVVSVGFVILGNTESLIVDTLVSPPFRDSSILSAMLSEDTNARIAVVKPIFSDTAYSSAFYNFYYKYAGVTDYIATDLDLLNVTVKDGWGWSTRLKRFLTSIKAS
ncbi:MAG: hypothetical protein ACFFFD_09980, partial [Promethearchaeota archaeon]